MCAVSIKNAYTIYIYIHMSDRIYRRLRSPVSYARDIDLKQSSLSMHMQSSEEVVVMSDSDVSEPEDRPTFPKVSEPFIRKKYIYIHIYISIYVVYIYVYNSHINSRSPDYVLRFF
jgi:hypothetical protein